MAVLAMPTGIEPGTGKFIYFLGANDFVLPGLFAKMKASLTQTRTPDFGPAWSGGGRKRQIHPHASLAGGIAVGPFFSAEECRHMMMSIGNWLTGQTTVYRREALIEAGGFDASLKALNDLLAAHVVASRYGAVFSPSRWV